MHYTPAEIRTPAQPPAAMTVYRWPNVKLAVDCQPAYVQQHCRGVPHYGGGVWEQYDRLIEGSHLVHPGLWVQFPSCAKIIWPPYIGIPPYIGMPPYWETPAVPVVGTHSGHDKQFLGRVDDISRTVPKSSFWSSRQCRPFMWRTITRYRILCMEKAKKMCLRRVFPVLWEGFFDKTP